MFNFVDIKIKNAFQAVASHSELIQFLVVKCLAKEIPLTLKVAYTLCIFIKKEDFSELVSITKR